MDPFHYLGWEDMMISRGESCFRAAIARHMLGGLFSEKVVVHECLALSEL